MTTAIPAALNAGVTLLLGLWGSAGQANFDNEIAALKQAINTYGSQGLAAHVVGISVGRLVIFSSLSAMCFC